MNRLNPPVKLDNPKTVKFGSKIRLDTPLTPFSFHSINNSITDSTKLSSYSSMLPSPRTLQENRDFKNTARLLAGITVIVGVFEAWTLVICRVIPNSTNKVVQWFQQDHFYCYLIPVLGPAYFFFMLINWMGMKYFRHN